MKLLPIIGFAGVALLLSACPQARGPVVDPPCGKAIPKAPDVVIEVLDDATVAPRDQIRNVDGRGQEIIWKLKNPEPGKKVLRIDLPKSSPVRFLRIRESESETRARRRPGDASRPCEAHLYKITVMNNGVPVPGDPILIIRE